MLDCRLCLRRALRAVVGDASLARPYQASFEGRSSTYPLVSRSCRRGYGSAAAVKPTEDHDLEVETSGAATTLGKDSKSDWQTQREKIQVPVSRTGRSPPSKAVQTELQYLKDPLKLASHVLNTLRQKKDVDKALELVRVASRTMQCTVSWNHIIGHLMFQRKVNAALKIYNEMKKRAQPPDARTYTVLLNGLGTMSHFTQAASKALSIFHSMFAPNSPVKPNMIHVNAALNVCARSKDLDSMWSIAARIPQKGTGAADGQTFTILLNGIREVAMENSEAEDDADTIFRRREKAIVDGRRLWDDVVRKWRAAEIKIDEKLVCAMGRLLLIGGRPRDWDDVLSLIEQTMRLPRLVPKLGAKDRATLPPTVTPLEEKADIGTHTPEADYEIGKEFSSVKARYAIALSYARPDRNTLSVILEACTNLRARHAAQSYWELLTDRTGYGIKPDVENYKVYFRLLRLVHASRAAKDLIYEMADSGIKIPPGVFRIALSSCFRDKNNASSIENANQIFDLMEREFEEPDYKSVQFYMDVLLASDKVDQWLALLHRLEGCTTKAKKDVAKLEEKDGRGAAVVNFIKSVIGVCTRLLQREQTLSKPDRVKVNKEIRELNQCLSKSAPSTKKPTWQPRPEGKKYAFSTLDEI